MLSTTSLNILSISRPSCAFSAKTGHFVYLLHNRSRAQWSKLPQHEIQHKMFAPFVHRSIFGHAVRSVPLILGGSFALLSRSPIRNDVYKQPLQKPVASSRISRPRSRLGGKLDYGQLCIGSVTGLFLGIIAGKLSSVIVFLSLSSYLLLQFLENRGIVTIPWRAVITLGGERLDLKDLFFAQPSFKISFVSSFLIAAFNV